jgi:hypothetical protein
MSDIDEVVKAFSTWAETYGHGPARAEVRVQSLGRPHRPEALAVGWQGVYCFRYDDIWLKVGKAGPNSGARWVSQHYKPGRAQSTLAFSLLKYGHFATSEHPSLPQLQQQLRLVSTDEIAAWIKRHTERVNLLIRAEMGTGGLAQLETIAHRLLDPVFEGRWQFDEAQTG